jgi:hypothetical protein
MMVKLVKPVQRESIQRIQPVSTEENDGFIDEDYFEEESYKPTTKNVEKDSDSSDEEIFEETKRQPDRSVRTRRSNNNEGKNNEYEKEKHLDSSDEDMSKKVNRKPVREKVQKESDSSDEEIIDDRKYRPNIDVKHRPRYFNKIISKREEVKILDSSDEEVKDEKPKIAEDFNEDLNLSEAEKTKLFNNYIHSQRLEGNRISHFEESKNGQNSSFEDRKEFIDDSASSSNNSESAILDQLQYEIDASTEDLISKNVFVAMSKRSN